MGKLIKNHWARLIVLTAAVCMSSKNLRLLRIPSRIERFSNKSNRSNSRRNPRILLAKNILGFPHQEPRHRCKASTDSANYKLGLRYHHACLGMAFRSHRWLSNAPQHWGETDCVANGWAGRCLTLPGNEPCNLLLCWDDRLFLGL